MPLNISLNASLPPWSGFSFADFTFQDYLNTVKPLAIFVIGISIYALFVFKFYQFLARRDVLKLNLQQYSEGFAGFLKTLAEQFLYGVETLVLIPLFVFLWFAVIAVLLLFLAKNQTLDTTLISSVALVAVVRITAYYNEELSKDLAKLIPFAFLAVFLFDASWFTVEHSLAVAQQIPLAWKKLSYYLTFVVLLELMLRIVHGAGKFLTEQITPSK